ncbi:Glycosyl hydrolase family 10 protein [Tripterygium wilfordii]|uniref:Glycosyl hydrolase family 10 protein n=1 Tax=Tripterygium wilfordii TaxID=458696 RepID=A0A7J7CGP1_TRIWF|nr:Glycosyl hydrolase family 10 protein [Tripterygium wilfordii]
MGSGYGQRRVGLEVLHAETAAILFKMEFATTLGVTMSQVESNSLECLEKPHKPQYGGGVIINPELNQGLKGWSVFGGAKVEHRELGGNKYVVAYSRNQPFDSVSQKLHLQKNKLYTFSAWTQVSDGNVPVYATFKTSSGTKFAGAIVAESNCWSMLKGGLTVDASGPAELYFESKNTSVEIWVDSISLQPFTQQEWTSHQDQSIKKARTAKLSIKAVDKQGNSLPNATISIEQKAYSFPFGCAINNNILTNIGYRNWFLSKGFRVTVFENELKWYSIEKFQGQEDYSQADQMVRFAKDNNIAVRGHNIVWDDPKYQMGWVSSLSPSDLLQATQKRVNSVVSRYKGQFIGWDVVNENLHFNFFESKLGRSASRAIFNLAHNIDGATTFFMNEYNTIEESADSQSSSAQYLQKLREIQIIGRNIKMGIGLEGHFSTPNIPYMRSSIDTLAATGLPIWLTEIDIENSPQQASYLEMVLREGYSHPKVNGIVMWAPWDPKGCYRMCLTDNNFRNLATGHVVDKLLYEWGGRKTLSAKTDAGGVFETSVPHGDYQVKLTHPTSLASSLSRSINVVSTNSSEKTTLFLQI